MNYSSSASARRALPEPPDHEFRETPPAPRDNQMLQHAQLLWTSRMWLFKVLICALLVSTLIAFLIPSRYESSARLMPPDSQGSSGLAMAAAAMGGMAGSGVGSIAGDLLGLKSSSDVFVGILGSRTVQDSLIQQFDLKKLYSVRTMDKARKELSSNTAISVDHKSQIIFITVTDKSPQRAAAMAQAYVEQLNRLVAELSTSSARRERIFLEERLAAVNKDLEAAERDFSQFASKNTAIDVKEQGKAMVEAAATLQGQLIAAKSQYEGLRQIYADGNPRVRAVRARIDELQHELEKLGGKDETVTGNVSQPGDSMYPSIRKLPLLGVTYADLYRRTKIQETVLETLTKQYELAKVQEAKEIPTVKELDIPVVPDRKSFPPRAVIILFGAVVIVCLAALFLLGQASWIALDVGHPGKRFAMQVWGDVGRDLRSVHKNGSSPPDSGDDSWTKPQALPSASDDRS